MPGLLGGLAACLLTAPGFAQDVPEWEHLGLVFAKTLSFYPGAVADGSLDTLLVSGVIEDEFGGISEVAFRRGLTEAEWTDASPRSPHTSSESVLLEGCVILGKPAGNAVIQRTCDGGRTWSERLWPDGEHIYVDCLAFRPSDGAALGCSRGGGYGDGDLAISHDNGLTWDTLGATFPDGARQPRILIEHPSAAPGGGPRLVVGLLAYGFAISDDGGLTWATTSAWIPGRYGPVDLALDPFDGTTHDGRLYATARDVHGPGPLEALLASDDGGETWTTLRYFATGKAAVEVAANGDVWVGSYDTGAETGSVWRSHDGGQTWEEVTGNTDGVAVLAIRQGGDGRIYIAGGGGVWRTVEPVSVASARQPAAEALALTVHPNPARQRVELALSREPRQPVAVVITDMTGREVTRTESAAGSSWRLDVSGWAPGVYHARIAGDRPLEAVSFTVVR